MKSMSNKSDDHYDAFICYSRRDKAFATKLEKALKGYRPPKDLNAPQRRLSVFRDESDFTGNEYYQSIDNHLQRSDNLIVLCSPNARASSYVNDEIARFASFKGYENIIPVLISGVPNNEAKLEDSEKKAFPQALCDLMEMPLAKNYSGFIVGKDKINKQHFRSEWYALLSDIFKLSRREVAQRDRKRQSIRRLIWSSISVCLMIILLVLTTWSIISRQRAIEAMRLAKASQLSAQAELIRSQGTNSLQLAAQLAAESMNIVQSSEAAQTLQAALSYLPRIHTVIKHEAPVRAVAFHSDGKTLFTAGEDGIVKEWDMINDKELRSIKINKDFKHAEFSSDANWLVTVKEHGQTTIWSMIESGKKIQLPDVRVIEKFPHVFKHPLISFSSNWNYCAFVSDRGVILWDLKAATSMNCINHKSLHDRIKDIVISPDGQYVTTAVRDEIHITSQNCQKTMALTRYEGGDIVDLDFSPTGKQIAVGTEYSVVWVKDIREERPFSKEHRGFIHLVSFDDGGYFLSSASDEPSVIFFYMQDYFNTGSEIYFNTVSKIPNTIPCHVVYNAKKKSQVVLNEGGKATLWDPGMDNFPHSDISEPVKKAEMTHNGLITSLSFGPNGELLATASEDSTVRVWQTGNLTKTIHTFPAEYVIPGPKGKHILIIEKSNQSYACELIYMDDNSLKNSSEEKNWIPNCPEPLNGAVFSADERYLTTFGDSKIEVFDLLNQKSLTNDNFNSNILTAAYMTGEKKFIVIGDNGNIGTIAPKQNARLETQLKLDSGFEFADINASGNRLATSNRIEVRVLDLVTNNTVFAFINDSSAEIIDIVITKDGDRIAITEQGGRISIWEVERGRHISSFEGGELTTENQYTGERFSPTLFSPDGNFIVVKDIEDRVSVWDYKNLTQVPNEPFQSIGPIAFSHDGKYIVTAIEKSYISGMRYSEVKFWTWHPNELIREACVRFTQNLTKVEWEKYIGYEKYNPVCQNIK